MKNDKKALIYALSAIMLWSTAAVAFKIALKYMDFIQLLFYASCISTTIFLIIIAAKAQLKELFSFSKKQYLFSAFLGLLNPFSYYLILLKAYSILPAQLAQPLNYIWPVMLVLLSAPLLKQKLKFVNIIALLISLTGVFFIASRDRILELNFQQPIGIALATGSSIIWAIFWIYNVKDKKDEIQKLALSFVFSIIYSGLVVFLFSSFSLPEIKGLIAAIYIGFFEMGFTYILWLKGLQLARRSDVISNFVFISPFLALIWIHLILNENIYKTTVLGLIFIIFGIFINRFFNKKTS